jgi:hypothetical protein
MDHVPSRFLQRFVEKTSASGEFRWVLGPADAPFGLFH